MDSAAPRPSLGPGDLMMGRYRLDAELFSNLPDAVRFRGTDKILSRQVDVYLLTGPRKADAIDAARRAALVDDPRLARIIDAGTYSGVSFILTEALDGVSLADVGPLAAIQARAVAGEVASALDVAARADVYHLALRPELVFLGQGETVKVGGLAWDAALRGAVAVDPQVCAQTDARALVSILYAALTARWPGLTPSVMPEPPAWDGAPVAPIELVSAVPGDLNTLCTVTLSGSGGPVSAAGLMSDLGAWPQVRITLRHTVSVRGPIPRAVTPPMPLDDSALELPAPSADGEVVDQDASSVPPSQLPAGAEPLGPTDADVAALAADDEIQQKLAAIEAILSPLGYDLTPTRRRFGLEDAEPPAVVPPPVGEPPEPPPDRSELLERLRDLAAVPLPELPEVPELDLPPLPEDLSTLLASAALAGLPGGATGFAGGQDGRSDQPDDAPSGPPAVDGQFDDSAGQAVPGQVVAGLAEDLPKPALDVGQASPIWPADSPDDSAEALAGPDGPVGGQLGEGAAGLGLTPPSGLTGRTAGPVSGPTRYTRWTPSRLAPPSWLSGQGQQAGASGPEGLTDSLAEQAGSPGLGGASADDLLGLGSPSGLDDSLDEATLDGLTSGGSASSGPTSSGLASSGLAAPGAALFDPEPDGSGLTGATAFDPGRPPGLSGLGAEGAAAQPVQSGPLDRSGYGASFSPPAAGVIDDESTIVLEPVHLDRSQVETGPPPAVRPLSARRPQPRGRVGSAGLLATPVPRAGAEAGDSSASLVAPPDGTAAGPLRSAGLLPGDATQDLPPVPDLPGLEPGRQAPGVDAVALDGPTAPDPAGGTARAGEVLFDTDTPSFERVIDGEPDDQAAGRQWSWGPVIVFVLVVLACLVLGVVLLLTQVGILGLEVDLSPIEPRAWPGSRVV